MEIIEHSVGHDAITFFFSGIRLRNAFLVFITDNEEGNPGLGNIALAAPTRITDAPLIASAIPGMNPKYEILAKSIGEMMGKKLHAPIFLFLDVRFESTDPKLVKVLKVDADEFCMIVAQRLGQE
jgi:hypothetical protein